MRVSYRISSCPVCIYREKTLSLNSYPERCPNDGMDMVHNETADKRKAERLYRSRYIWDAEDL